MLASAAATDSDINHDPEGAVCQGKQYSSAACGMGLIATAAFAEMGLITQAEGARRCLQ